MKTYHLQPSQDDWELFAERIKKPVASFGTKSEALACAREIVSKRSGSLKILNADGSLEEERTFLHSLDSGPSAGYAMP